MVFDCWPTHRFICVLRRVFQVIKLQACPRSFAPSLGDQDLDRVLVLPHCVDLLPLALTTIVGVVDLRRVSSSSKTQILSSQNVH